MLDGLRSSASAARCNAAPRVKRCNTGFPPLHRQSPRRRKLKASRAFETAACACGRIEYNPDMPSRLRFLGYGVRRTEVPTDWGAFAQRGVDELCSVADCIAKRPDGWVQRWDFNRASCYGTEAAALATTEGASGYQLLAYALVTQKLSESDTEVEVDADVILPQGLPELPTTPVPAELAVLGYDVVSKQHAGMMDFECSPLSCCGLAGEVGVNRYCLINDLDAALRLARRWDQEQPEPGPYYVVQVLRRA